MPGHGNERAAVPSSMADRRSLLILRRRTAAWLLRSATRLCRSAARLRLVEVERALVVDLGVVEPDGDVAEPRQLRINVADEVVRLLLIALHGRLRQGIALDLVL